MSELTIDAPKVVVTRGTAVDEYPLPLPMIPTYREMNIIKRLTGLTIGEVIAGAGGDPDADMAVAIYAIKRENPAFSLREAERLFDLPFGAIEIDFGEVPEEGGSPEAPGLGSEPDSDEVSLSDSEPES